MKKLIFALVLTFVVRCVVHAGDDGVAKFDPQKPKAGDRIRVTYDGSFKTATLAPAKEITLNALVLQAEGLPVLVEVPLKKSGKTWSGAFTLSQEKAQSILFKFVSAGSVDDNNENVWTLMVCGADGKEVKGAHVWLAQVLFSGNYLGFKKTKDVAAALDQLMVERRMYPDNISAMTLSWRLTMRANPGEETNSKILSELNEAYAAHTDNEEIASQLITVYNGIGKKETGDSLRKTWIEKNPHGKVAEGSRLSEVYAEKEPNKRVALMEAFLTDFPQKGEAKENYQNSLMSFYLQAKKYEKVAEILDNQTTPSGSMYNSLAWAIIEKGEKGPELERAVAWAKKGIDFMKSGKEVKVSYMTTKDWKTNQDFSLGMINDTYAYGLFKLGRTQDAIKAYAEAVRLTDGKQADINERYMEAMVADRDYRDAMAAGAAFVKKGILGEKIIANYRTAYTAIKGSDKGFDDLIAKAQLQSKEEMKKQILADRVNKRAPEFSLKSIEGKVVNLADLRGKVVVVDFWATWCGPCKSSFPFLQKMYEKYKDNPNVMFLALDTWENETGAKREELVKKFMADNKYTFPVLYDEGFVEKYGVEGIPTKFLIDKKGKIQFKSIGFLDGQKMMDELTIQIDTLLSDGFYSMR